MALKISSPTHSEINECFCNKNRPKDKDCKFEFGVDCAIRYSKKFGIPAKIYISGIFSGILPTEVKYSILKVKRRKI